MNIQVASDLHLDQIKSFESFDYRDYKRIITPISNVLILAGDICHIENIHNYSKFFKYLNNNFQYIIYIPGNHEFYNKKHLLIDDLNKLMEEFFKNQDYNNIIYLNNKSVLIDDILFTGSCLWCNPSINPPSWFNIDIGKEDIIKMHKDSINYLNKVSSINHEKHVIITHYPPIYIDLKRSKNEMYKDLYKDYYENDDIFLKSSPKYWIFGHTHKNFNNIINDTIYISNQRKDKTYKNTFTITL
jgi:predicted phosphohydrolase